MSNETDTPASPAPVVTLLPSGGQMGDLVQSLDWSTTPLGTVETWPQSLRTAVNILLTSRYQMWMGWGPELTFFYNDAYKPTLGLKHPWALGKPAREVWAEIWRDIGPRIEQVIRTGRATYDEGLMLILERSGFPEETYHTFSYSPLADDTGRISGLLCVVMEETERVIGERRMALLRELGSELASSKSEQEVIRAVERRVAQYDRDLPFTLTYLFDGDEKNTARLACAIGIERGHAAAPERIERESDCVWPAEDVLEGASVVLVADLPRQIKQPLPTGAWDRPPTHAAVVAIQRQGQEKPAGFMVAAINPFRRYDAAYSGFVALLAGQLASALANARAYEEERRRAEALAEIDRAKTAFFSNVSHEFRTPLTLMLGPIEDLLSKPAGDGDFRELLSVVHRNGLRLQRLVNTLLDFSRIEAGRAQASYRATDLAALTAELASGFRSTMERAGLEYRVDCRALGEAVYVDRDMWEKVVLNLVSNAFKYTLRGSVSVGLEKRDGSAELTVSDTGVGIPEEDLPRLFERFHRVESTRGRTNEGTGIGLALVQELVKLHGGAVSVASQIGKGSTFTVRLPFGSAHLPQDRVGAARSQVSTALHADTYVEEALRWIPAADAPADGKGSDTQIRSRILLADDNADMRDYVRRLLEDRYAVTTVANGEEALSSALAHPPDLVLTDVMMPVLDGFAFLKELRSHERTRTLPVILLSARAGEESRIEGLDAGADDYLVKPFTAREVLARVEAHLSLARIRKEAERSRALNEKRLSLALDAAKMVAWEWDPSKDEIFATGELHDIFGMKMERSDQALALLHPEDLALHRAEVERVAREGGSWAREYRIRRAGTGELAWIESRAAAVSDDNGGVERVVGVIADITGRKTIEQELLRRNKELERINSELEEFTYVASHDLQEPLRAVNIYTQLLLNRSRLEDEPLANEFAAFIENGVRRMESLIRDLLSYARVVHREQVPVGGADLNRSLQETLAMLDGLARDANAKIVCQDLPTVHGEERQLSQVFQNLLSNSLKYRRRDEPLLVRIGAERLNGEWVVSVADNGIGFDPQYAERIFGLFKRLHNEDYPGTGLGLAICRRIIERYGGRIWAASDGEGSGATFSFAMRPAVEE